MTLLYYVIFVLTGLLFLLLILSLVRYNREKRIVDLQAAAVVGVAAVLILGMNLAIVRPTTTYDSVRFEAEIRAPGAFIFPFPNEPGLVDELEVRWGVGEYELIDTEKGKGLKVSTADRFSLEAVLITDNGEVDYEADLQDGESFWVHFTPSTNDTTTKEIEMRIIHQSPEDFHSKQLIYPIPGIEPGWNHLKYEYYTDDFFFTQPTDGI
jgi:hypothetical protein